MEAPVIEEKPPEQFLKPRQKYTFDLNNRLLDSDIIALNFGIEAPAIAAIVAGGKEFMILDTRGIPEEINADFLVIDDEFDRSKNHGYKGIRRGDSLTFGRSHFQDRFRYPSMSSRDHFQLNYDGKKLVLRNLKPTNKTSIVTVWKQDETPSFEINDQMTVDAERRLKEAGLHVSGDETAPYGFYKGHPILGRQSKHINNSVYVGRYSREAIVVDGENKELDSIYQRLHKSLTDSQEPNTILDTYYVLKSVMLTTQLHLPYEASKTYQISSQYSSDQLVGLSKFVEEKAGVCRHQALLASYLLERLIKDGLLVGRTAVERNAIPDAGGAHAWAIFSPIESDKKIVIDATHSFVGTKEKALEQNLWRYEVSDDVEPPLK